MAKKRLVTIPNAATELGITRQFLWRKIRDGEIPVEEIDGVTFVNMSKVTYKKERTYKSGGRPKTKKT